MASPCRNLKGFIVSPACPRSSFLFLYLFSYWPRIGDEVYHHLSVALDHLSFPLDNWRIGDMNTDKDLLISVAKSVRQTMGEVPKSVTMEF